MTNDYIYIKLCSNNSISLSNIKVKLINKCNKIVFTGKTGCAGTFCSGIKQLFCGGDHCGRISKNPGAEIDERWFYCMG